MSRVRQLPQAKYELLSENKRTSVWSTLGIAASVITIISVTCVTIFLAWKLMTVSHTKLILMNEEEISKKSSEQFSSWKHRLDSYGAAYLQNKIGQEQHVINPPQNLTSAELQQKEPDGYQIVCYYALPKSQNSSTELMPESVDASLCTHIIIASASIENNTVKPSSEDIKVYKRVVALKDINHELKVMLSIAGVPSVGGFNDMVATPELRKLFIHDVLSLLAKENLDGVDFDWEFPAWESDPSERTHFAELLCELRQEIVKNKREVMVSVAVAAPKPIVDLAYDVPRMAQCVDFVSIMTYDYHFYIWYLPVTGYNAPLYSQTGDEGYFRTLNMNWSVNYWVMKGMPKEKIMIGLPTYGHTFLLMNPDNHNLRAPSTGVGSIGSDGYITYTQVCWFINNCDATVIFDRISEVPYAFNSKDWISYEDEQSLAYKADYIVSGGFAGAMVFSLSTDDYDGKCSRGVVNFPLTRRIKLVLTDDEL